MSGANERVGVGFIGVAGRGFGAHLKSFSEFPDVDLAAVCDVYQPNLDRAVEFSGGKAKPYLDYKELVTDPAVDAVVISTPPHWHALMSLAALEAGKDVYCEKPMCRFPAEGKLMADYAAQYSCITQVGTQMHAAEIYHRAVNVVRSGALGKITAVRNFCAMNDNSEGLGNPADAPAPEGLDWDAWIGPAPKVPFNIGRFRDGMHRYFKDYVDSWLHELGPHILDLPFWAMELGCPIAVSAAGGRYATSSIADVPDTFDVLWEFPDMVMTWTLMQASSFNFGIGESGGGRKLGIVFDGTEGTLLANYGVCQVLDKKGNPVEGVEYPVAAPPSPGHDREFIDCVKSRTQCSCSFANHLPMHTALNLAHIALKLERKLHWDEANWQVVGDAVANAMTYPDYRAGYALPTNSE